MCRPKVNAPNAAHSSAAEDDNPEPSETSLVIDITPPGTGCPAIRNAHTTPATYAAHPVTSPGLVVNGIRTDPSTRSLKTVSASESDASKSTVVRCGSAIGNDQPRL